MKQWLGKARLETFRQLDPRAWPSGLSHANIFIIAAILLATVLGIVETEESIYRVAPGLFDAAETFVGLLFLAEFALRLWAIAEDRGEESALRRRVRFILTAAALVDLAVIAATFLPAFGMSASSLRLVRLARIARLAKLGRTSTALKRLHTAIWLRRYELVLTLGLAAAVLLVGATALYWIEGDVQPDKFGSVPRALWWAVTTLTTIGYGDVYPVSAAGKIVASILALAGVGLIALPAGIMAGAMHEVMARKPDPARD